MVLNADKPEFYGHVSEIVNLLNPTESAGHEGARRLGAGAEKALMHFQMNAISDKSHFLRKACE